MIDARLKKWFFDRPGVVAAVGTARAAMLSKAGAYVRQRARTLLRRRKRVSAPGSPPSVHSSDPTASLKNIQFGLEPSGESVIIGPVALNQFNLVGPSSEVPESIRSRLKKAVVPGLMEHGGVQGIREVRLAETGQWVRRPWGYKLGVKNLPIWKATPAQRGNPNRVLSFFRKGRRVITKIEVSEATEQRARYATYPKRQFMGPALEAETPNFPKIWADSIKAGRRSY